MAIQKIPGINIAGANASGNKAFGGYVFSMDYNIGITEPTKLTLSFISDTGTYSPPVPSVTNAFNIKVGGQSGSPVINDKFYAIRTELSKSSNGRRLDVQFYDGSIVLDRTWVGLHKKMGDKNRTTPASLIILGSETHPCDVNDDRVFSKEDLQYLEYDNDQDPCKLRCPGENDEELLASNPAYISNPLIEECRKKNLYQLLEVEYNFAELLYHIKQKGIKINLPQNFNQIVISGPTGEKYKGGIKDYYYANYTGTLREVLTRWCDDLAFLFYWENGGLNFIDIHTRPPVDIPALDCVNDTTEVQTLEGTVSRGAITYYGRAGSRFDNTCPDSKRHELSCLTLFDLFGDTYKPTITSPLPNGGTATSGATGVPQTLGPLQTGSLSTGDLNSNDSPDDPNDGLDANYQDDLYPYGMAVDKFEESCVCSFYDPRLRWQYILYNYYGLTDQGKAAQQLFAQRMDRFGGLKIMKVCSFAQTGKYNLEGVNTGTYSKILNNTKWISPADKKKFVDNSGYFIIAELDQKKLEAQYQIEHNLAENFLGKHWIKAYWQEFYGADPEVQPVGQYFAAGNVEAKDLEFTHFFHSNSSRVGKLCQQFKIDPLDNLTQKKITDKEVLYHNLVSLLYYQKNVKWTPDISTTDNSFKNLLDKESDLLPRICDNLTTKEKQDLITKDEITAAMQIAAGSDSDLPDITDSYYDKLVIMAMYPSDVATIVRQTVQHVEEEDSHYQLVSANKQAVSNDGPRIFYGLTNKTCVKMTIKGVPVFTPAGMSANISYQANRASLQSGGLDITNLVIPQGGLHPDYINNPSGEYNTTAPNFAVMVTASRSPFIEIPKMEVVQQSYPDVGNTLKIEYMVKNINDNNIGPLANIQADAGVRKQCTLSLDTIKAYHELINEAFKYSILDPYVSKKLTVAGLALPNNTQTSIAHGLEGISVRIDDQSAVQTTYSFGNSLFKNVSIDVSLRAMEQRLKDINSQSAANEFFTNRLRVAGTAQDIPASSSVTLI